MSDALLTVAPQRWALLAYARLRSLWQRWFLWLLLAGARANPDAAPAAAA